MKISNVRRSIVTHVATDAPAVKLKGGIESATFTCTCGKTWNATATDRNVGAGYFALTSSSITVNCPQLSFSEDGCTERQKPTAL